MDHLDQKLLELYDEKNRKEKIQIHLEHLYSTIERQEAELVILENLLAKEERDVELLEKDSLYNLFLTVLGNKQQQLEKERHEYLQAFMKVNGLKSNLKILHEEKALLQKTHSSLQGVEQNFTAVLTKKINQLIKDKDCPPLLSTYNEKISSYHMKIKELETCIKKGSVARKYLHKIHTGLQELSNWGIRDTQRPGKKVQKKIDRINKDIYIANNFLQKFENELEELEKHFDFNFRREISQFELFLDQFVAALITDWIVNLEIFDANNLILIISDKVIQISEMLEYEIEKTENYIDETHNEKADYILNYIK